MVMSHPEQRKFICFVKQYFADFFEQKKVLEIGSLSINRSVREFFTDCDYTGVDLEIGKCVDLAIPGQLVDFSSKSFDVTISCECFEHNPFWLETFINMLRMTKPGGLVIVTCACYGRPEHGTTRSEPKASPLTIRKGWDYYCNLSGNDFLQRVNLKNWFGDYQFFYNHFCKDLYFIGVIKDAKQKKEYLNEFN
ncbi:MAG: methyltransferase domain-containing protein, partial [Cyanobacteria bacterium J083]